MSFERVEIGDCTLYRGDCLEVLLSLPEASIDSCVTDPPYGLTFMGKDWDRGVPGSDVWAEVFRVLKPGSHLLAFAGTRTYHRMACAIEDAGFEIRDCIAWVYGSGFPKSLDVSKAIDKQAGEQRERIRGVRSGVVGNTFAQDAWSKEFKDSVLSSEPITEAARQWTGWGTALKPACEPIVVARKPLAGTVAENVLAWSTGGLNIDGCRVHCHDSQGYAYTVQRMAPGADQNKTGKTHQEGVEFEGHTKSGRWPANLIHDGSEEVVALFPIEAGAAGKVTVRNADKFRTAYGEFKGTEEDAPFYGDSGSAARFFYCAKATAEERSGSNHPTVKPLTLMQYLVRLVTPKGGSVLDPFAGTGTTGEAGIIEGLRPLLIEREPPYFADACNRLRKACGHVGLFG